MAAQFSEGWSGTPMWQLAGGLQENMKKEQQLREAMAADVLYIEQEGDGFRAAFVVGKLVEKQYIDTKVRGPRRKLREEAVKDGYSFRKACREAPHDQREEAVQRKQKDLVARTWTPKELPREGVEYEEQVEEPMRARLAKKPRGNGWTRVGDKDFFKHASAPMVFDPSKGRYFKIDADNNSYVDCDMPHDPMEYPVGVNVANSLVGSTDEDLNAADRPRTLVLKELVKTGAAMKNPLFFLDQPAACFALFDGIRGGAAVEWCSKHFHTKLLPQLSAQITFWNDLEVRDLLTSILAELDVQLVQQPGCCWEGVSVAIALTLGDRAIVCCLGGTHALVIGPNGSWKPLGCGHSTGVNEERKRVEAAGGEAFGKSEALGMDAALVRKVVRRGNSQIAEGASNEEEVRRILDECSDIFSTLGFVSEDTIDGKSARSNYKKLALKVHPDKAPEELKDRAKAAFEKIEKAAATIEELCERDAEATTCLQRVLFAAGESGAYMSQATAAAILEVAEGSTVEEAGKKARELRESIVKLGMLTDGSYAHPDQEWGMRLIEEAVEAIAEPSALAASRGSDGQSALTPVQVTRGLGLRDLKLPRRIVTAQPQVDVIRLEQEGAHHLVLLSSGAASLTDEEVFKRVSGFSKQPKAASLLVAADAAARNAKKGVKGPQRFASCIVSVFEVSPLFSEPSAKRARKDAGDKVRARHILLKHKDLKVKMDPQAHLRSKGPIIRPLAQAERELLRLKETLSKDLNQFPALARKHSECKSCLQPGQMAGDMGWISKGTLGDAGLEEIIFNLDLQSMSDLIVTGRGVHLVQRIA